MRERIPQSFWSAIGFLLFEVNSRPKFTTMNRLLVLGTRSHPQKHQQHIQSPAISLNCSAR